MTRPHVLLTATLAPPPVMQALETDYVVHRLDARGTTEGLPAETREAITAVVTTGGFGASAALMDTLPNLALIACYGVGVDAIDLEAAARRGIPVTNTPDVLTEDVADMAVALWAGLGRDLVRADHWVREGRWERDGNLPLVPSLGARTVGFLGFGRIGQAVAARVRAFGATVLYHKRSPLPESEHEYVASLPELAWRCDDLMVCCVGGAATRHLVNADVLSALGERGHVINISRGSVIDEAALVTALEAGRLGGAALDVFADEPHVPRALRERDDVLLTPHVGSATVETRQAMGDLVLANLRAHYAGAPLPTPVP